MRRGQGQYQDDVVEDFGDPYESFYGGSKSSLNNTFEVQLKVESFLNELKLGWLGLFRNEDGELVRIDGVSPRMNVQGAENLIAFLRGKLHQFNSLSWYQNEDINFLMEEVSISITRDLIRNYKKYDIDKKDIQVLENEIEAAIYSNYKRAYKGFTSNQINKNISRVEHNAEENKPKGKMNFW